VFCFSVKQNKKVCFGRNDGLISLLCLQSLFVRPFFFFCEVVCMVVRCAVFSFIVNGVILGLGENCFFDSCCFLKIENNLARKINWEQFFFFAVSCLTVVHLMMLFYCYYYWNVKI
jgi:hypothetical protein